MRYMFDVDAYRSSVHGAMNGVRNATGVFALAGSGAAAVALLASGCGGSSGSSGANVAQVDSTKTTTTASTGSSRSSKRDALVAFSACMRKNGVPNFPDPDPTGRLSFGSENGIDDNAPQFKTAQRECQNLLPNGGKSTPQEQAKHLQEALDYAACMRKHGLPKFPDPKASADGGIEWGDFGVDPNTPQFKAAQRACQRLVPGGVR